jgi:sugar O-acyltransferase (sialic acid O-acetyltransferase NeuD family)
MDVRDLLIVGAGGFARETAEAVHTVNEIRPTWRLRGFLDDDPTLHGSVVGGLPVLGPAEMVHELSDAAVLICTGRPGNYLSRRRLATRLDLPEERYGTIVHPSATVGRSCRIGSGSVLLAHVDVTADVVVGRFVAIMPQAVLTHDVQVGDYASLAAAVRIGGGCRIGQEVYLGSGACLREGIRIGAQAMVGLGAVVVDDVPAGRLWYGTPAADRGPAPLPSASVSFDGQELRDAASAAA